MTRLQVTQIKVSKISLFKAVFNFVQSCHVVVSIRPVTHCPKNSAETCVEPNESLVFAFSHSCNFCLPLSPYVEVLARNVRSPVAQNCGTAE